MIDAAISPTFVIDKICDNLARQEIIDRYPEDCPICNRRDAVQILRLFTNDYGLREQVACRYCIYNVTRMVERVSDSKEDN